MLALTASINTLLTFQDCRMLILHSQGKELLLYGPYKKDVQSSMIAVEGLVAAMNFHGNPIHQAFTIGAFPAKHRPWVRPLSKHVR